MPEADRNRLQEDAIRRAREMQSRARFPTRPPAAPAREAPAREQPSPALAEAPEEPHENSPQTGIQPTPGLLDTLFQDKERTVILALLVLLSGEEGNHELLFALLFLLM